MRREQVQEFLCLEFKNILNSNGKLIRIIDEGHSMVFSDFCFSCLLS